jgi:predicted permease
MIRDIQETFSRLVSVFRRRTLDQDFEAEFAAHIDLLTEQNERRGLPRDEARRQAILKMGGLNATRDLHREARGLPFAERCLNALRNLGDDLVHAVRSLAKARSFSLVCVASLGIGMGTVIGILIVVRMLGTPPGMINTEGLVELLVRPQGQLRVLRGDADEEWSYPNFTDLRDADTGMTISAWTIAQSVARLPGGGTRPVSIMYVSANYFDTLGIAVARGAGFDASVEGNAAGQPVVIVRYDFWKIRLASDPDILGKTITLNRVPHVVVGITPEWFQGHLEEGTALLWVPLGQHPRLRADESLRFNRSLDWIRIHGRLLPGVRIERANAAVSAVMSGLAERYPASNQFKAASVEPYHFQGAANRNEFRVLEAMFLGAAGLVLLVVCLNISGMVLVRSAMRERELSIRQAIGAARGHLIRYLLCEAIVLATVGGSLAFALLFGIPAVAAWYGWIPFLPPPLIPDASMFAICVGLCLVTSLMFGLLPAIRFSRPSLISALKDEAGGGGRQVGRVHRLAAAVQVGIAVPFLVIGGVLLDHVRTMATAELGFEPKGLLAAPVDLANVADTDERAASLLRAARENLAQTGGIASVGLADGLPLDFRPRGIRVSRGDEMNSGFVRPTRVDDGYLKTMGIRLVRGRGFTAEDRAGAELVAVIAEPIAVRLFPNSDALGQRITLSFQDRSTKVVTIVGVISDLVGAQMSTPRGELLLPLAQHPASNVYLVARSADVSGSMALASAFRNALNDLDRDFDAASIMTGEQLVRRSIEDMLLQSAFASVGGGAALTLAALGVYGVIGFLVAMRTREIAVRIALGASNQRVLRKILTDVVKLVVPGVALGLIVAIFVVRNSYLSWYSLGAVEPLVYTVGVSIAIGIAILAGLPSARRAASVDPAVAMRSE